MKTFHSSIRTGPIWCRTDFMYSRQMTQSGKKCAFELRTLIRQTADWHFKTTENVIKQCSRNGDSSMVPDRQCFSPYREVVYKGKNEDISTSRTWMWPRYIHRNNFPWLSRNEWLQRSLLWCFSSVVVCAWYIQLRSFPNIRGPLWPVSPKLNLSLSSSATEVTTSRSFMN